MLLKKIFLLIMIFALTVSAIWAQSWPAPDGSEEVSAPDTVQSETQTETSSGVTTLETGSEVITRTEYVNTYVEVPVYYQGRHGYSAYVDLATGNIYKVVPVGGDVTGEQGNEFVVIGQVSEQDVEAMRKAVAVYTFLRQDGSLDIYNMEGEHQGTIRNSDTEKFAQELWGAIEENREAIVNLETEVQEVILPQIETIAETGQKTQIRSTGNSEVDILLFGHIIDLQEITANKNGWVWIVIAIIAIVAAVLLAKPIIRFFCWLGKIFWGFVKKKVKELEDDEVDEEELLNRGEIEEIIDRENLNLPIQIGEGKNKKKIDDKEELIDEIMTWGKTRTEKDVIKLAVLKRLEQRIEEIVEKEFPDDEMQDFGKTARGLAAKMIKKNKVKSSRKLPKEDIIAFLKKQLSK